jgi:quinol monooxygenase YgiN
VTAIRVVVQGSYATGNDLMPAMVEYSRGLRKEAGNLQAEDFGSTEFPGQFLHLELWESAAAFDAHWAKAPGIDLLGSWQAPNHHGTLAAPRRQGENGIEFYRHVIYSRSENYWAPAEDGERVASVRFPAWGAVRIVIQGTSPPGPPTPAQLDNSQESRLEPGCIQFEHFRGIEYPENTCLMELWSTPEIYDIHWLNRLLQQAARAGQQPPPPLPPVERRYGRPGAEWYAHSYYTLVDDVWQPENTDLRMVTVRW